MRDELVDPEAFLALRAFDRHAEALRQFAGAAGMVDVAVGEQDLLDPDAEPRGGIHQQVDVAAGIDEGALHGFAAPEQGAVLLEGGDGDDAVFHWCS